MELIFWQNAWFVIISLAFLLYTALDGFDLGIGILVLFSRDRLRKERLAGLIAPYWDANELWLVIGAGSLFMAFPKAFGTLLGSLYLPLMAVVLLYVLRAVSLEWSYHPGTNKRLWLGLFGATSLFIAVGGSALIGALLSGLHMTAGGTIAANSPAGTVVFMVLGGIAGVAALGWHGKTYAAARGLDIEQSGLMWVFYAVIACIILLYAVVQAIIAGMVLNPFFIAGLLLFVFPLFFSRFAKGRRGLPFALSALAFVGAWLMIGAKLYPTIIGGSGSNPGLSIFNASAPLSTLKPLGITAMVGILAIGAWSYLAYRWFNGKGHGEASDGQDATSNSEKPSGGTMNKTIKELVRCKSCSYIMEAGKLKDRCPACGVPAKMFEPYKENISPFRKLMLSFDIHPVLVHFPQAFTATLLVVSLLGIIVKGGLFDRLMTVVSFLGFLLPFTVLFAFLAGLFDGTIRFRRVTTPILIRKMLLGSFFFICSAVIFYLTQFTAARTTGMLLLTALLSAVSLGCATLLGLLGVSILHAKFPG